ncbi:MAG: hypothetical protein DMG80_09380 [Acidobacteria bacterium]|jgi:predicted DNA-binding ribbon-helix-helix protein|nr:MAG: hypothetical protein DMG80_09380 [Acidobacteriota bacterium]
MPADTDVRIRQLCARLCVSKDENEMRTLVSNLRLAISEYLSRARSSLQTKAFAIREMDIDRG